MSDIFLSYASVDAARIAPIVDLFEDHKWSVWWDRRIPPGKTFDEVIEQALKIARCVVVVWTKSSIASRWVKAEASEAIEKNVLVPILLDHVDIPLEFRRIEAARLATWNGSEKTAELNLLLNTLAKVIGNDQELREKAADLVVKPKLFLAYPPNCDKAVIATIRAVLDRFSDRLDVLSWDNITHAGNVTAPLLRAVGACRLGLCYFSEYCLRDEQPFRDNSNVAFIAGIFHALSSNSVIALSSWIPIREETPGLPFDFATHRILNVPRLGGGQLDSKRFKLTLYHTLEELLDKVEHG